MQDDLVLPVMLSKGDHTFAGSHEYGYILEGPEHPEEQLCLAREAKLCTFSLNLFMSCVRSILSLLMPIAG